MILPLPYRVVRSRCRPGWLVYLLYAEPGWLTLQHGYRFVHDTPPTPL